MTHSRLWSGLLTVVLVGLLGGASYGKAGKTSGAKMAQTPPKPIFVGDSGETSPMDNGFRLRQEDYRKYEAIRLAREWQYKADVAMGAGDPLIAYPYYEKIVETFPGTTHAWVAKVRLETARTKLLIPRHSPAQDDSLAEELTDFLTWP